MTRRLFILLAACVLALLPCADICRARAQQTPEAVVSPYAADDFAAAMKVLVPMKDKPAAEIVIACAKHFAGTPYVAGSLEKEPERLRVSTRETDCILFVEMCVAMTLTARSATPDFETYCGYLQSLRYRNGRVEGYSSRLHYTSEWLCQAQNNGWLDEITGRIGGKPYAQKFSFMSKHPQSYAQLANAANGDAASQRQLDGIKAAEQRLNAKKYYLIDKAAVAASASKIRSGDIICFNSAVPGLDIAHVGIALRENGVLTFIHASSGAGKVIVNSKPLADYVVSRKNVNGIRVARLAD